MTWRRLTALEHGAGGCSICCQNGSHSVRLAMDAHLGVGFGDVTVTRDDEHVWSEMEEVGGTDHFTDKTAAYAEGLAATDPDHDWRIRFYAPLSERLYQRHGPDEWVLVETGMGFA